MKFAAALLLTLAIAGCLGPAGRRSVTTPDGATQDRYCRDVTPEECDRAVSRAQAFALGMSESSKALVAAVEPADDGDLIVAFAPAGDGGIWSPPILRVDRRSSPNWAVDYWKVDPCRSRSPSSWPTPDSIGRTVEKRMRTLSTLVASAFAIGLLAATPAAVSACSSDHPTFDEAVRGARAIARVTMVEGFDPYLDDRTLSETYRVERVLKGSLPNFVTVAPAWTALCHDAVGSYVGGEGVTFIVALDLPYYNDMIHPVWAFDRTQGLHGSAGLPTDVTTLAELEEAIVAAAGPPNTSTDVVTREGPLPLVVLLLVAAALFGALVTRFRSRPIDH